MLGGTTMFVPARSVHDAYSNAMYRVSFDETFSSDYYFGDLSEWDANGDGTYAEDGVDAPDYLPELGVTRVPVSTLGEANLYVAKAIHHLTAYELDRAATALLLSNVATMLTVPYVDVDVPIDSAIYFEMTGRSASLIPPDYAVTKLYASFPVANSRTLTLEEQTAEMERSYNFIIHAGHGSETSLTVEENGDNDFSAAHAYALSNAQHPFFLSGACRAGSLAYPDSAGESLVTAPNGGAIGYLGNSGTGLGLAGGAQFVDEFLRYALAHPRPRVGDAMKSAHRTLPQTDTIDVPTGLSVYPTVAVPTVDLNSYQWTHKSVVWLGDGLLPIWTDPSTSVAPTVSLQRQAIGAFTKLVFSVSPELGGTITVDTGAALYQKPVAAGQATIVIAGTPAHVWFGFESATALPALGDSAC